MFYRRLGGKLRLELGKPMTRYVMFGQTPGGC
jgi:hypothetical protein